MLCGGVVLLHDNSRPHTAASTQELLDQFGQKIFDHPPYSPDLAPSDFHLFLKLKEFLGGKRFGSDEESEKAVTTCLNELAAEEYDLGILKLVDRYDKCLNVGGDYVEKRRKLPEDQHKIPPCPNVLAIIDNAQVTTSRAEKNFRFYVMFLPQKGIYFLILGNATIRFALG
ncbi:hypothetical protein AVEN_118740-1 [Araneus ventricosus]|uniref:Histone-lysine N-methyltransferase SETMAR n=1 Tax=Araneus ventricosus TaxID=182803 RepID=A0A4Y2BYH9_ARAVE|nr:hypothetical protein AVEN_118740-1 [Araneus ventricosus]